MGLWFVGLFRLLLEAAEIYSQSPEWISGVYGHQNIRQYFGELNPSCNAWFQYLKGDEYALHPRQLSQRCSYDVIGRGSAQDLLTLPEPDLGLASPFRNI